MLAPSPRPKWSRSRKLAQVPCQKPRLNARCARKAGPRKLQFRDRRGPRKGPDSRTASAHVTHVQKYSNAIMPCPYMSSLSWWVSACNQKPVAWFEHGMPCARACTTFSRSLARARPLGTWRFARGLQQHSCRLASGLWIFFVWQSRRQADGWPWRCADRPRQTIIESVCCLLPFCFP